jgi:hypothetical protein
VITMLGFVDSVRRVTVSGGEWERNGAKEKNQCNTGQSTASTWAMAMYELYMCIVVISIVLKPCWVRSAQTPHAQHCAQCRGAALESRCTRRRCARWACLPAGRVLNLHNVHKT